MPRLCRLAFLIASLAAVAFAPTAEPRHARRLEAVRNNPSLLLAFVRDMPKGGDLHNHLSGAIYAESFINFAAQDGLCVDRATAQAIPGPCQSCDAMSAKPAAKCAFQDQVLYNKLIDAWSMRGWPWSRTCAGL